MGNLSQINDLLPREAVTARKAEMKRLQNKWQKTGLLEGLRTDGEKGNLAQLLENQAKQILVEANRTSTQQNTEEWAGIALPLVRRVFGEISSKEFVSVQPMNMPNGLVFYLEFKFASGQPGFNTNSGVTSQEDSVWGVTDARRGAVPGTGGLYDAGRFGYSINDYSSSAFRLNMTASAGNLAAGTGSIESCNLTSDVNFDSDFSASVVTAAHIKKIVVPVANMDNPDFLGARAFTLSATGLETVYNKFTTVSSDETLVTFVVSGSLVTASDCKIFYHKQPTDITRGDFEESKTQEEPLDIPSMNIEYRSEAIVAKTRKMKAQWTPEFAQDIEAYHNIDAEAELTGVLGDFMTQEIDLEILDMLVKSAQTRDYWSARLGYEYNAASQTFAATAANASAYTQQSWFQTLGTKIQKMSNEIDSLTMRGGANFLVTSPRVCTILESISGYGADTDGNKKDFMVGVTKIGGLAGRFKVYKNSYLRDNMILVGFRGSSYLESGAVYAPYIPMMMTPTILDTDNFTPRKGVITRYAKKLLRPEFYGKIYVEGLDTI